MEPIIDPQSDPVMRDRLVRVVTFLRRSTGVASTVPASLVNPQDDPQTSPPHGEAPGTPTYGPAGGHSVAPTAVDAAGGVVVPTGLTAIAAVAVASQQLWPEAFTEQPYESAPDQEEFSVLCPPSSTATSSDNTWFLGAGSTKVAAVSPPDDDDASYLFPQSVGNVQLFGFDVSAIPAGAVIVSVGLRIWHNDPLETGGSFTPRIRLGGTNVDATTVEVTNRWQAWQGDLSRPGGGDWTVADLTDLRGGMVNASGFPGVSTVELAVVYLV